MKSVAKNRRLPKAGRMNMLKIFCFRSQSQRMRAYINNEDKFSFIHSLLYFPFIKVAVMQKVEEYFNHEDEINPFRYCSRPQYGNYVSIRRHNLMKGGSIQKVLVIHSFSFCLYIHTRKMRNELSKKVF